LGIKEDLQAEVTKIFKANWEARDGELVPEPEDLQLGNDAVNLDATVLYADMSGSTKLVDDKKAHFAAEIYKTYLTCAARIIKSEDGAITAYDGDRVMGVFIGKNKNTRAVKTALKINWAKSKIINPSIKAQYPSSTYQLKHVIGVDTSKLFVSRIGVRNDNDLVWVGRAANYAAKLSSLSDECPVYITGTVFDAMLEITKYTKQELMWVKRKWTAMNDMTIYSSTWTWSL
jgi:class 3 adenylate cyclase